MAVNKVEINGKSVLDLTGDTVTKGTLMKGTTAHNAAGVKIVGEYEATDYSVFYIDLEGSYPNYTCPVAMADIKAAYEAGKVLECRCAMGLYTATLPLFIPMPDLSTWVFSGSGELAGMGFPAQTFTVAVTGNGVLASDTKLATKNDIPDVYTLPVASSEQLGGVKPVTKTDAMTKSIGVDDNGGLYTEPAAWYVTVTQTSSDNASATADKTPQEIFAAYQAGYAVYANIVVEQSTDGTAGVIAPLVGGRADSGVILFSTVRAFQLLGNHAVAFYAVFAEDEWLVGSFELANKDDIPAGVGDDTPDYVLTAADALAKKVVNHIGSDNIVFAAMADAHLGYYTDTDNAAGKQAGQALKRLNERCDLDFVVHLGDYTTGAYNTTVESAMQDNADYQLLIGSKFPGRQAWCVGNHDDAPYQATANRMTQTQIYAAISRKNLASNGYVPDNTAYGYMDFPALRLRLIYLDTHDRRSWGSAQVGAGENCTFRDVENISAAQLQWLADHALDFSGVADPSQWSILAFSHAALNSAGTYTDPSGTVHQCNTSNAALVLKAYATKKSGSITHGESTVTYNFTEVSPAAVIACIHGHEHRYANETVGGAFLSICCPNVMNGRERVSADGNTYTKTAGTANGTSFCVFSVNRAAKKIYVDHYGPGIDREFGYTVIDPSGPTYTNVLPSAIDTDGSIYNGVGWQEGYRLNSSGAAEGFSGSYLTGFIPIKKGDVVRLKNVEWQYGVTTGLSSSNQRISFYDADFKQLAQSTAAAVAGTLNGVKNDQNIWTQFTVQPTLGGTSLANAAYFRLNCAEISGDSIITVNEEIT